MKAQRAVQYTTTIISNGSHFLGEPQDTIAQLLRVLATEPLDHTFEKFGNFILPPRDGHPVRFWGNFAHLAHVFEIDTDDPYVIALLTQAIRTNQERDDYGPNGNIR